VNSFRIFFALTAFAVVAAAQVVITEIHYHPVELPAFDASGNPLLDLTEDVHEFVEIQNIGVLDVDISGWTLSGGAEYTVPAGTPVVPPFGFRVIAKNPPRLTTVYGLPAGSVLGPYTGSLSNGGDTVRIRNVSGVTQDYVSYDDTFPWATGADELGAQDRFTGLDSKAFQYKGRSLQRVSSAWRSNDPANWLASPLSPGPTPGAGQAVARAVPQPVVAGYSVTQVSNGAPIIRAGQQAKVVVAFTDTTALGNVQIQYFVDNINSFSETRIAVNTTSLGNGAFSATLPAQANRSIVRFRILADRGSGQEVVSPRADDAAVSPVGVGGALEGWHGYFVTPARTGLDPIYDVLVPATSLTEMTFNITANPRRVTAANASGIPRETPFVAETAPIWNGTAPGVFAHEGQVWDIHLRYHASRYHRAPTNRSYKFHFPEFQPFNGATSIFETNKPWSTSEGQGIFAAAGLPVSATRSVEIYYNDEVLFQLEQGEFDGDMLDEFHARRHRLNPAAPKEATGVLYKSVGNIDATANNLEGPYTRGDVALIAANSGWTALQRYSYVYGIQNKAWTGTLPIKSFIEGMWAARGDSFASPNVNIVSARAWCNANLDVDAAITALALFNWMGAWDDVCHNQFFWRRANGRWSRLPWDFDLTVDDFQFAVPQSIYVGETGAQDPFFGPNWYKDTLLKCFRTEFRQKMWELNNTLLDPVNLDALGFPNTSQFASQRQAVVNNELGLGVYQKPNRPTNIAPADGAIVIASNATLNSSAYTHSGGGASPHSATKWEIRSASGTYLDPVYVLNSTTSKTSLLIPFDQLMFGQTYFWRVTYFDSLNHFSVVSAETSFTFGDELPDAGGLVIHEILADNRNAVEVNGTFPDYIELRNNTAAPISLAGKSLTDDPLRPTRFTFPVGASIAADSYVIVYCDNETASPGFHSGFGLSADGQTVLLLDGPTILDAVTYGPQAANYSIGRTGGGTGGFQLVPPSPGSANVTQTLGATSALRINEWSAFPAAGDDWFELYNNSTSPVAIGGLHVSDSSSERTKTRLPALSFIAPLGYVKLIADGTTQGANHCDFRLSAGGDNIILTAADGVTPLQSFTFSAQIQGVSEGLLPDGGITVAAFPFTASPNASNHVPATVVINELLANSTEPFEDAVELFNPGLADVDISNWWISDDRTNLRKLQLPAGTIVPAGGYLVIYENQFAAGFALNSTGDEFILSASDAGGNLTGYRAQTTFGASNDGVTFGRVALSTGGAEFWPLKNRTFGVAAPADVGEFRTGSGAANGLPQIGPLIINEVNYHPADTVAGDNKADEYIELHNILPTAVTLDGWKLKGDVDYAFPSGVTINPGTYFLIVGFDPADAVALFNFRATYGLADDVTIFGPFSPNLSNETGRIELSKPGQGAAPPDILVDKVEYFDTAPWPGLADGSGPSLQRQSRDVIGNDPGNWGAADTSPGNVNEGQEPFDPNGAGVLQFEIAASTVIEEDGTATLTVKRLLGAIGTVTVNYFTTPGNAIPGVDYTPTSGTLTFLEDERTQTISVPLLDDARGENLETFSVTLSAPTGGSFLGSRTRHTVTIDISDGGIKPGRIQFASTTASVAEGAGDYVVTIVRVGGNSGPVTAQLVQQPHVGGAANATANVDYTPELPATIAFEDEETEKTFTFSLLNDPTLEADEHLVLRLHTATGGASIGIQPTHDLTITNDDAPPPPYKPEKAGFAGIVNEGFTPANYGFIQFNSAASGSVSGKFILDGATYPFSGKIDSHGELRRTIRMTINRVRTSEVLILQMNETGTDFTGSVRGFPIRGERNATGTAKTPALGTGKYTALMRADGAGDPLGVVTLTVKPTGGVAYLGALADGTTVSGATAISRTRAIPMCSAIYAGRKGCLYGFGASVPGFRDEREAFEGDFIWHKPPPGKPVGVYPLGVARTNLIAAGTIYLPPGRGEVMLPAFSEAEVALTGGNLAPEPAPFVAAISAKNKLTVSPNASKLKLALTPATGAIKGTFKHTDGKVRVIRGVVIQQNPTKGLGIIEGHFQGTTLPGAAKILPTNIPDPISDP
jgi:Calx-beta domain/Lamin Tail Domain/CotH kinase protein